MYHNIHIRTYEDPDGRSDGAHSQDLSEALAQINQNGGKDLQIQHSVSADDNGTFCVYSTVIIYTIAD